MTWADLLSPSGVLAGVGMMLALGAAPVFIVRVAALLYPKGHPRRIELPGEMAHIKGLGDVPRRYLWLGGIAALAVCEGLPARARTRPRLSGYLKFQLAINTPVVVLYGWVLINGIATGDWIGFPPGGPDLFTICASVGVGSFVVETILRLRQELRDQGPGGSNPRT